MDSSAISSDNYGATVLQTTVMKQSQDQQAQMALQLIQDTAQNNAQIMELGSNAAPRVDANAAGANPGDRLGTHINIAV